MENRNAGHGNRKDALQKTSPGYYYRITVRELTTPDQQHDEVGADGSPSQSIVRRGRRDIEGPISTANQHDFLPGGVFRRSIEVDIATRLPYPMSTTGKLHVCVYCSIYKKAVHEVKFKSRHITVNRLFLAISYLGAILLVLSFKAADVTRTRAPLPGSAMPRGSIWLRKACVAFLTLTGPRGCRWMGLGSCRISAGAYIPRVSGQLLRTSPTPPPHPAKPNRRASRYGGSLGSTRTRSAFSNLSLSSPPPSPDELWQQRTFRPALQPPTAYSSVKSALKTSLLRAAQISSLTRSSANMNGGKFPVIREILLLCEKKRIKCIYRLFAVSMEHCRNELAGETGDSRENPLINGIVRHDSHRTLYTSIVSGCYGDDSSCCIHRKPQEGFKVDHMHGMLQAGGGSVKYGGFAFLSSLVKEHNIFNLVFQDDNNRVHRAANEAYWHSGTSETFVRLERTTLLEKVEHQGGHPRKIEDLRNYFLYVWLNVDVAYIQTFSQSMPNRIADEHCNLYLKLHRRDVTYYWCEALVIHSVQSLFITDDDTMAIELTEVR
ncbi:hypothetical protein PR048_021160 [Dryococelus australis]|uniref:Uncharacterized protein n=1 Tax=Dryococelus australis TaxID=614101 RepID=A0ABQ9GXI2_9NEOP|nr:hypothetical protein PR048_021160 [Dryococelus australis]